MSSYGDSAKAKKLVIFLLVMSFISLFIFPLVIPIFLIGATIWFYRFRQWKKAGK